MHTFGPELGDKYSHMTIDQLQEGSGQKSGHGYVLPPNVVNYYNNILGSIGTKVIQLNCNIEEQIVIILGARSDLRMTFD